MTDTMFCPVITKREEGMPFYITTIGTTTEEKRVFRPSGISSYQILYSEEGSGKGRLYDKLFDIPKGSLLCLPPNTPHDYFMNGEGWKTDWITFGGWAAEQFFDVEACIFTLPEDFDFLGRLREIFSYRNSEEWPYKSSMLLYGLLLDCRDCVSESAVSVYRLRGQLTDCLNYIEKNYERTIELAELAEVCGVSEEYLCRIFKSYTGMRPFEYINRLRIQRAKEYLAKYRKMKISEIGRKTGFQSNSYFSLVFRSDTGMTPAEYRRLILG